MNKVMCEVQSINGIAEQCTNVCLILQEATDVPSKGFWPESAYTKEVLLDASSLGDVPAVYRVPQPAPHQMPVIGVYIDPRVRTGFRYKVRPMQVRPVI